MNARDIIKLAAQREGNTNITIEDIPEEIRNEVTMLKVERSIKTSFTEESNQLFSNNNRRI